MQALFNLVKNFATYKTDKKKRLHVIGDGKTRKQVEEYCKKYENEIEFVFTGSIARENLDDYLIKNVDILFGVGTCVVEGAALKLPSVVLILDMKEFDDLEAFWLYNSKEYTVGILKEQKKDLKIKYTKIHDILDEIYSKNNKKKNGENCYKYYIRNHENYDQFAYNFLNSLKNTTLTYKKIKKCIKYIPYSQYSHELYKLKKLTIIKKITFFNKTKWLLFGFIEIFKEKRLTKESKYYILGIPCKKTSKKVWDFPAARFDNRKDYLGGENVK
ncbi:glycosyltransferase [Campylobacter devanensis]|nr:glycosyltransferase [Campylobacter sp. P0111]